MGGLHLLADSRPEPLKGDMSGFWSPRIDDIWRSTNENDYKHYVRICGKKLKFLNLLTN